ncbi:MAG TPA: alpha-L-fucosidase [Tepidisphaeraceae bacterium]|nr:alpha-L-fucosidase [Tepidisphaeraceae bacterium]
MQFKIARSLLFLTLVLPALGAAPSSTNTIAEGGNEKEGWDMAPPTVTPAIVKAALEASKKPLPPGPFEPTWDSLKANYKVPPWFKEAKFGLFMHWGLYSVPAHHNEWYQKHMYAAFTKWHAENFGPQDQFGYKDFIPKFTAEKFDPDAWAELFEKSGAKYVMPTAQHHDNFALWDSELTQIDAKDMGPKRDLIGDLGAAVRKRGLKFGVSNHGIENFDFIRPQPALAEQLKAKGVDLYDPKWNDIYHVADRSDAALAAFLTDWLHRNYELIDKYQPDILWFDNGVDHRILDPLKLQVAAYYYNRAAEWKKDVSISTKKAAYAPSGTNVQTIGSIIDFEKIGGRSPSGIRWGAWQVDEPIGSTWGYTTGMRVSSPGSIISKLADTVSKNGNLLLNLSPKADGTIPQEQQDALLEVGKWLKTNGEAIYGTHAWTRFGEGGARGDRALNVRFTVKGDALYAIILGNWPGEQAVIKSLSTGQAPGGKIQSITLLGGSGDLQFKQDADGLHVQLPSSAPGNHAHVLKITGLEMNQEPTGEAARLGNPR